jgi:2-dehydropantoate 2-reductase
MQHSAHVIGAGGIGVAAAVALRRAGWTVTVVEADPAKLDAGRRDGLSLDGLAERGAAFVSFDEWAPRAGAVTLLCTKTYDNAAVLPRLADPRDLVPIQNGYDPLLEGMDHAAEAIASFVSQCPRDRPAARITRPGTLHIGARRAVDAAEERRIDELASALARGGVCAVARVADVRPYKATKLMYNAAISPLAASAGLDNASLLAVPMARRLFFALLQENHAILRRAGLSMETVGPFHPDTVMRILRTPLLPVVMGRFFQPSLRGTYCSMSPDVGGGRTEVDAYNGHLVRLAGDFPCPLNRAMVELVERVARRRLPASLEHLRPLAQSLIRGAAA